MSEEEPAQRERIQLEETEAISTELIAARVDIHDLLLVIRFQAFISIPLILGYILYIGKDIIIPIVISFSLAYFIFLLAETLEKPIRKVVRLRERSKVPITLSLILIPFATLTLTYIVNKYISGLTLTQVILGNIV